MEDMERCVRLSGEGRVLQVDGTAWTKACEWPIYIPGERRCVRSRVGGSMVRSKNVKAGTCAAV